MQVALALVVHWSMRLSRNILLCVGSMRGVLTLVSFFGCSICRDVEVNEVYLGLGVCVIRVEEEECVIRVFRVCEVVTSALL